MRLYQGRPFGRKSMNDKRSAPPGWKPGGAEKTTQNNRTLPKSGGTDLSLQGSIAVFENNRLAGRIAFCGQQGLVFVTGDDGFHQVGNIIVGGN